MASTSAGYCTTDSKRTAQLRREKKSEIVIKKSETVIKKSETVIKRAKQLLKERNRY